MNYVIIGNSAAAVGCITGIRKLDQASPITVISDESEHTYSRPLISYWLAGKVTDKNMSYRDKNFYKENNVTPILGVKAVSIDRKGKKVVLENGQSVPYGKLLIATGSSPFVPPMDGMEKSPDVFTFLSWESARGVKKVVTKNCRAVVLGAGLVGLKAAEGLSKYTKDITVIDLADRVLPSILDNAAAAMVKKHLEKQGIKFLLNCSVKSFNGKTVTLSTGSKLDYDVFVAAVGVRPNTSLARDAGLELGRGIVTDNRQRTNDPDIYAAGDCTESLDISSGTKKVLALLPNAYIQGYTAGNNMAGGAESFDNAIPMNSIGFFGYSMITAGSMEGTCYEYKNGDVLRRLFINDNRLIGFIMLGEIDRAGIYTAMVRNRVPIDNVDIEAMKSGAQLAMYSKPARKEMLTKVR
jgi:NAD(P)H-nitrite reductase large subunit